MLGAWLLVLSLLAMPVLCADNSNAKRFLFVIDTSAGMKPFEMPLRETLFDLIYSGARGRMTNGDTYGLWLVSDRNDTSFPMQTWRQKTSVEIAAKAVSHVKDHGFKGKARPEVALADAKQIIKDGEDLTVIFISNGETPLLGTPFDEPVNARYHELASAMKAARATVNTAMVARDGNFTAWAVNSPQFLLEVPELPARPKRATPVAKSNAPATNNAAPVLAAAKPRISTTPIIITKETVAQERRSYLSSIMTSNAPEPVAPVAVVATNAAPPAAVITPTNVASLIVTNQTNAVASTTAGAAVTTTNRVAMAAAPTNVEAALEKSPAAALPVIAATIPSADPLPTKTVSLAFLGVTAGAGGAFLVLVCVFFLNRSRHREPSLISQAIARERMSVR